MKRHLPSLNALRTFEAVGRLGRMVAAAEELSVTPGAVSHQIRHLESFLGLNLLAGTKKTPVLSEEGKALLPRLTSALDEIEAAIRAIQKPERETLDVSCLSSFMMRWLIPRLYRFNSLHPTIDVRLSSTDKTINGERDRFDIIVTVGDASDPRCETGNDKVVFDLFPEKFGPVLAPELASTINLLSPAELPAKALLRTRTRPDAWDVWRKQVGVDGPEPQGPEFEHYYFTLEAANAGLGICLTPEHLVSNDIKSKRLLAPFGFITSDYKYFVIARKRSGKCARFSAWLDQEAQELREEPPS